MKTIDYKNSKGSFKIKYLNDNIIYEGTINIDDKSIKTYLANMILDNEEGSVFNYITNLGNYKNIETIELLEKNISLKYIETSENEYFYDLFSFLDEFINIKFADSLNDNSIYFQFYYKPSEWKEPGTISNKIIYGLKELDCNIDYYYFFLNTFKKNFLEKYNLKDSYNYLCSVPSHNARNSNSNSIRFMIDEICSSDQNYINGSKTLVRKTSVEAQKLQGKRSVDIHLDSIVVSNDVTGKNIILIDDVTTSGSTLKACRQLLLEAGANSVICFSFSKSSGGLKWLNI